MFGYVFRKLIFMKKLDSILLNVENPGRYIGGEFGICDIKKKYDLTFCIAFPDVYEIGMSNLGIKILYNILNNNQHILCERVFAPWVDMGAMLRENDIELFSLETRRSLRDFDILGFSIQYEMAYTNILYMLELSNIPFYAKERDESFPLLVAGGPCTANPEPFAEFFDIICIGDGEEVSLKVADIVRENKGNKTKILEECKKIEGIYVPSLCVVKEGVCQEKVKKSVVKNLDLAEFPAKMIVPNIKIVHDRPVVELFRGCYAGCRFCQACFFYRPIRNRSFQTVLKLIENLIKSSGYEEIGISSLSTGDYCEISELLYVLPKLAKQLNIKVQIPSLRLDSYDASLFKLGRSSSITFAPEAGTQRLRDVINKNITDEDIDITIKNAISNKCRSFKLYFMIGLPTETDADLDGIVEICERINRLYVDLTGKKNINITISVAVFVPKPVTPFQWVKQIGLDEMTYKQNYLYQKFKKIKNVSYNWHDSKTSFVEAVLARGDRKLAKLIEKAYKKGAKFDSWGDKFDIKYWNDAAKDMGIDLDIYVAERDLDAVLPWNFIDFGVSQKYLKNEYIKALNGLTTEGCKFNCNHCGANKLAKCSQHIKCEEDMRC
jgi:radical SAM family uncharacterized protein